MTGTQLELRDSRAALVIPRTDSWMAVVEDVAVLAQRIAGTELVPAALRGKAPAIAASILYGREIGLPPMTALRSVYVVNGQVALKAEAMRGLILAAGHELVFSESTSARCVVRARRKGQEDWSSVTWTIDDARAASLVRPGSPWHTYPRAMLKARATAEVARDLFADVISGFMALEEVDGVDPDVHHDGTEPRPPVIRSARRKTSAKPAAPLVDESYPAAGRVPDEPKGAGVPDSRPPTRTRAADPMVTMRLPPPLPIRAKVRPQGRQGRRARSLSRASPDTATTWPHLRRRPPTRTARLPPPPPRRTTAHPGGGTRDTSTYKTYPAQRTKLHAVLSDLGVRDRAVRLRLASLLIGRDIDTSDDLTRGEAGALIDTLEKVNASQTMRTVLSQVLQADDPVAELDTIAERLRALAAIPEEEPPWPDPPPSET